VRASPPLAALREAASAGRAYNERNQTRFNFQRIPSMLTVGDAFPEYKVKACVGIGKNDFKDLTNQDYEGKWVVYFFYPKDFTFICPTELVAFSKKVKEFKDRDCEIVAGSTDNEFSHQAWRQAHNDLKDLAYPMIAAQRLSSELGILDANEGVCLRATFIVDPTGTVQWAAAYGLSVGRSVEETLRVLDALQSDELCPCNWQPGQATIKV
jgi:peroxiredoxin (alkyl hydroperoxide reductase subunit C)